MILFDFSDKSVKALKLSPRFLGGKSIAAYVKGDLKEGLIEDSEVRDPVALTQAVKELLKKAVPKPITDQEAAVVLHDERAFSLRLNPPPKDGDGKVLEEEILRQAAALLPVPVSSLATAFLGPQFIAVDQRLLNQYLDLFKNLGLQVQLVTPESQAIFAFVSPAIPVDGTVLFLDIGSETTNVIVLDQTGVIQTFTEPIETAQLSRGVIEVLSFAKGKFGKDPVKIFLGGGGVLKLDQKKFAKEVGREVVSAEDLLKTYPISIGVDFGQTSRLGFLGLFGLAQLLERRDRLNLAHRS